MSAETPHYIVCGAGAVSHHLLEELMRQHSARIVVVDDSAEQLVALRGHFPAIQIIEGDATDDDVLKQAEVERAAGLFAALSDDKSNLFACLAARALAPNIRIVSLAKDPERSQAKLLRAGANAVVSAGMLGGLRMASEVSRPTATRMLDKIMRASPQELRVLEIEVCKGSEADGKTLQNVRFRERTGLGVIAVVRETEPFPAYNPGGAFEMMAGDKLVVLGGDKEAEKIRVLTGTSGAVTR